MITSSPPLPLPLAFSHWLSLSACFPRVSPPSPTCPFGAARMELGLWEREEALLSLCTSMGPSLDTFPPLESVQEASVARSPLLDCFWHRREE